VDEEGRIEFCQEIENFKNYVFAKTYDEALRLVEEEESE
jgi:hypothetical protein